MKMVARTSAVLGFALAAACGGRHATSPEAAFAGTWKVTGPLLASGDELAGYLVLDGNTGDIFSRSEASGVLACGRVSFAVVNADTVTFERADGSGALFHFAANGAGAISLTDAGGAVSTLARADSVPASSQCAAASISAPHALTHALFAGYGGNLVFDGQRLWANADTDVVVPIDPADFSEGAPLLLSSNFGGIKAAQGSDFWAVCNCGGDNSVRRETQGSVNVDEIDTRALAPQTDLGVDSAAFDGTTLWLYGYDYAQARPYLWHVDSGAEPDVLLSRNALFRLSNITFHQGSLWGLTGQALVEIDTATFQAVKTVPLPEGTYWYGLASANGMIDVIGVTYAGDSVPPTSSLIQVGGL